MRKLLVLLVIIVVVFACILFGHSLIGQKGYVLIALGNTTIEMSVISALITLTLFLLAIRFGEWALRAIFSALAGSRKWFGVLSQRRQKKAFYDAINALATGQLVTAKKSIARTFGGEFGGVNYILAADIERQLNNDDNVVRLLEAAHTYPQSEETATIQLATWFTNHAQFQSALDALKRLPKNTRKTKTLGKVWLTTLAGLKQWHLLKDKLAEFKKVLGDDYIVWAQGATQGEFNAIVSKQGANALIQHWQNLSKTARSDIANQRAYLQLLIEQGMSAEAEPILVSLSGKQAKPVFYDLFKMLKHPNPTKAVATVEHWIKNDPQNGDLYSVLAHLAANSGDDQLAEKAVTKSLDLRANSQDAALYASLLENRQDFKQASLVYKNALSGRA